MTTDAKIYEPTAEEASLWRCDGRGRKRQGAAPQYNEQDAIKLLGRGTAEGDHAADMAAGVRRRYRQALDMARQWPHGSKQQQELQAKARGILAEYVRWHHGDPGAGVSPPPLEARGGES